MPNNSTSPSLRRFDIQLFAESDIGSSEGNTGTFLAQRQLQAQAKKESVFKRPVLKNPGDRQGEVDLVEQNKFFLTAAAVADLNKVNPETTQPLQKDQSDSRLKLTKFNEAELKMMLESDLNRERAEWKHI